jgi:hypothetical protein
MSLNEYVLKLQNKKVQKQLQATIEDLKELQFTLQELYEHEVRQLRKQPAGEAINYLEKLGQEGEWT